MTELKCKKCGSTVLIRRALSLVDGLILGTLEKVNLTTGKIKRMDFDWNFECTNKKLSELMYIVDNSDEFSPEFQEAHYEIEKIKRRRRELEEKLSNGIDLEWSCENDHLIDSSVYEKLEDVFETCLNKEVEDLNNDETV